MGTRKPHWIGRWAGGRIKQTADGQRRWVIERERGGKLYVIPLDVTNEQQAQNHYERFKADIEGYLQAVQAKKTSVVCLWDFRSDWYQALIKRKCSQDYAGTALFYVQWWESKLRKKPLASLTLGTLQAALRDTEAVKGKIVALKSFTKWLRQNGHLRLHEDPTVSLPVPQATPGVQHGPLGLVGRRRRLDLRPLRLARVAQSGRVLLQALDDATLPLLDASAELLHIGLASVVERVEFRLHHVLASL